MGWGKGASAKKRRGRDQKSGAAFATTGETWGEGELEKGKSLQMNQNHLL